MEEGSPKDNRLEALKLYADWSKWLAAIDTAAIGSLATYLLRSDNTHLSAVTIRATYFAIACLLLSLWGACQFIFSMPGVVMTLGSNPGTTTHALRNPAFLFSLGRYHQIQYVPLYFAVAGLIALLHSAGALRFS